MIRYGPSLLAGLVVCGRCGLRMAAAYNNNGSGLRYSCCHNAIEYGSARCQTLTGGRLDAFVSALVLQALEPAALEVSLQVAADVEAQRHKLHQHWQQRLERAQYAVERADRQYSAVELENRLVARPGAPMGRGLSGPRGSPSRLSTVSGRPTHDAASP